MNGFDISSITNCYIGGTQASAIYIGSTKLWPTAHDYSQDYFTIESLEDNNLIKLTSSSTTKRYITYRTSPTRPGNPAESGTGKYGNTFITLNTGDKVYISEGTSWDPVTTSDYTYFESSKTVNVYGNVNSVRDPSFKTNYKMIDQTYFYYRLFYKLKIVDASNLVLPYTTLRNYCYMGMFEDCTTLTTAPALPATTLTEGCYDSMFKGCTSLTATPALAATSLPKGCYQYMFNGCTSLTTTPVLNILSQSNYSMQHMFDGCSSLLYVSNMNIRGSYQTPQYMFANCTSLISASNIVLTDTNTYCWRGMFENCTSLTTTPQMNIQSATSYACYNMFKNCTSLTNVPASLPSAIYNYCYYGMFEGCTSLTTAPALPATTLYTGCYRQMFKRCTSLVNAPALPATTLSQQGYLQMFYGCTNLNNVKCLAIDLSAANCVDNWLTSVSSTGTFTKNANMTSWPSGSSGIPTGWTVVDDSTT